MIIANGSNDPTCLKQRIYAWGTSYTTKLDDGRYKYGDNGNSYVGLSHVGVSQLAGKVVYLEAETQNPVTDKPRILWSQKTLWYEAEGARLRMAVQLPDEVPANYGQPQIRINGYGFFIPAFSAIYTPNDWEKTMELYENGSLDSPWFDESTLPLV